jgi:hypothetical protein
MAMGGLEQFKYPESKPIIHGQRDQSLPDYMESARLAALDRMPASVEIEDVQREKDALRLRLRISTPGEAGKLAVYYGSSDALTFADRWASSKELGEFSSGEHTVRIPASQSPGACRALLSGPFGSVWSGTSIAYPTSK